MRDRSLRWRVTALATVVMAIALVVIGVAVEVALSVSLQRDQQSRLSDRATRASLLVDAGTAVPDLLAQTDGQGIRAVVVTADGQRMGAGAVPVGRVGPARADRSTTTAARSTRVVALSGGGRLVLAADPDENAGVLARLRDVMLVVGAAGLAVTALALLGGVRVALRPLEHMTRLARGITAGDRGRRLRPRRLDTELGRTAQAFDEMLDALETAQARAEDAAEEARRSEATVRQFLSDAAHELRTPLTGVQSLAESLVRRPDADLERRERVATTLVRETRRAGALVADMLELARVEDGPVLEPREVDLAGIAAAEAERVALLAPTLTVSSVGDPVTVTADPARVTQILANLLGNARRHSPDGGTITVSTALEGDVAVVDVADEGAGVPQAERERVFDRLVRLDDSRTRDAGGAGLGLPIARALARAHGGDLVYVDDPGGARFRLTLPPSRPPVAPPVAPPAVPGSA